MQDNKKNKLLDSLRPLHGESGRAHPKKTLWGALAGPPKKKTKIFLVVVAHRVSKKPCANTTDLLWAF